MCPFLEGFCYPSLAQECVKILEFCRKLGQIGYDTKITKQTKCLFFYGEIREDLVPKAGIEPAQYFYRQILSLLRLPVSPLRHIFILSLIYLFSAIAEFCYEASFCASGIFSSKILKCSTNGGRTKKEPTTPRHFRNSWELRKSTVWFSSVAQ